MTRSRFVYGLPIVALAVLLTACTPGGDPPPPGSTEPASAAPGDSAAPSPSPEGRPERDALALGPDGMGTLVFGVAPPTAADSAMIVLEPGYCVEAVMGYDTGLSATDPAAALWVPIPPYRDGVFGDFGVHVEAGVLMRIDLYDGTIPTTEGIRIDLVDDVDFSMFMLGTTVLTPDASQLLRVIADTVRAEGGGLTVRGHTDALPWKSGGGNNWSLSAGRAEATRQAMLRAGIREDRFFRIEGVADRELLVKDNPQDPRNRRISILMMH